MIDLTNPPLLNGVLIGGVANFVTATKPVVRVDGSALVIGDRWYNPSTGVDGFWNGTYWLTNPVIKTSEFGFRALGTVVRVAVRGLPTNYSFEAGASQPTWFLHRWSIGFLLGNQSTPSTNYIIFRYFFDVIGTGASGETGTDNVLYSTQNQALADNTSVYASGVANIAISKTHNAASLGFGITSVGTATWGGYASMTLVISAIL